MKERPRFLSFFFVTKKSEKALWKGERELFLLFSFSYFFHFLSSFVSFYFHLLFLFSVLVLGVVLRPRSGTSGSSVVVLGVVLGRRGRGGSMLVLGVVLGRGGRGSMLVLGVVLGRGGRGGGVLLLAAAAAGAAAVFVRQGAGPGAWI